MKNYLYIFASLCLLVLGGACSNENPFGADEATETGRVSKKALSVELSNPEGVAVVTRAAVPTQDDFNVDFIKDGETTPYVSYLFADMPEVVTLPVGVWKAVARYGNNATHAWEAPYFEGSTTFNVVTDKITEVADPIVARLANVRVSIKFDAALQSKMSPDSKVTVKVGESGTLDFSAADADRSGYFAYVDNSNTLTATFSGNVEDYPVVESKVFDTVSPGAHYAITFRLHDAGAEDPGSITGGVVVDASVTVEDMNITIDGEEDIILEDDLRPIPGGTTPVDPVDPNDNPTPLIVSATPAAGGEYAGWSPVNLDAVNEVRDNLYCGLDITSYATDGITAFTVKIDSDTLTPDELDGVGLAQNLDLVNPGAQEDALAGLGFPVNVGGKKFVQFNITGFLPMLSVLGPGNHNFILTVSDANGTTVKTLKLQTK